MHRVFTHLRLVTDPSILGGKRFFENPDSPTLVEMSNKTTTKKFGPTSPGVARDSFFFLFYLFIHFIYFINSIQFLYLRPLIKTPAHDDCQSPLPGQVGPGLTV
jgi:hypothetical protein